MCIRIDAGRESCRVGWLPLLILLWCAVATSATAQISNRISKVTTGEAHVGAPLSVQIEVVQPEALDRVELAYRQFGQRDFQRAEMQLTGSIASFSIPASVVAPPFVEYYILMYARGSSVPETYPIENAEQQPLKILLQSASEERTRLTILSPEEDESVSPNDVLVSFSLGTTDSSLDTKATKVYLDEADLSTNAIFSGDLVVVKPQDAPANLQAGLHAIRVDLFDTAGHQTNSYSWRFWTKGATGGIVQREVVVSPWRYNSSIQLETRSEDIQSTSTPYNRATISAGGSYNEFRLVGRMYVTNEETDVRQPQNRFYIGAESPWLNVGYGDSYPIFTDLIMGGKRVRGFTGSLTLGAFNLDVVQGSIVRKIEGDLVKTFPETSLSTEQHIDSTAPYIVIDSSTTPRQWGKLSRFGTFDRNITVIRPIFGPRDGSHMGFSYLKSTDDVNSIRYGIRPQENLVIGSDLLMTFDNHNVEIAGQSAFSASNRDISRGTFTDEDIDSLYSNSSDSESTRQTIRTIRDIVSKFITVNQFLVPLGTRNMPTLSYEGSVALNYFGNAFRWAYLRRGESYESFGQPFIRTDVAGYNVSDRLRLFENRLLVSGGFEQLNDNTAQTKPATTTSTTINVGISYYPRTALPTVTLGYLRAANVNGRNLNDTLYAVNDQTNRFLVQLGREFSFGSTHNNATLSVSISGRDDQTVRDFDTRNTAVTLSNSATFTTIPLQGSVSLSINSSSFVLANATSPSSLSYVTLFTSAQYRLLEEQKLRLSASLTPTFGDIQRIFVETGAQYYFIRNVSAQAQLSLYFNRKLFNYSSVTNDVIGSVVLRAEI